MGIFSDLINLIFPETCLCCNQRIFNGEKYVCLNCLNKIPRTNYYKIRGNKLEEFLAGRFLFESVASFAFFTQHGIIQPLIHELKYKSNPGVGIFLGEISALEMINSSFLENIDYLVPVPLHPEREKKRGYNQSQKISEGIYNKTRISVCSDNLVRLINNPSQTTQSRYERWANTENIFSINNPKQFENKHLLLIDDIITTGSTLESCARVLLEKCSNVKISIFSIGTTRI